MLRLDDLAAYAEARQICHVARDAHALARHTDHRARLEELVAHALLLLGTIVETLRAGEPRAEARGFRQAAELLVELRAIAYDAYLIHALHARAFDDLMRVARRCEHELDRAISAAHHRARLDLEAA